MLSSDAVADAVKYAASIGYRHFDCASVYGNEGSASGRSSENFFRTAFSAMKSGSRRSFGMTSTVKRTVIALVREVAGRSDRSRYLDLYLMHWPFPNHHPPGCDVTARNPHAVPYIHENYMRTWRQDGGTCRSRPCSPHRHIEHDHPEDEAAAARCADQTGCQTRWSFIPIFNSQSSSDYLVDNGIQPIGYSPIGSPARPERDRTPEDTSPTEDPAIREIAERLGVHPAVVCIKWAVQRGQVPIPFSTNPSKIS